MRVGSKEDENERGGVVERERGRSESKILRLESIVDESERVVDV